MIRSMNKPIVMPGRVIILSGPSGAGKTTLQEKILRSSEFGGKVIRSISATTRHPRVGEKGGRDYIFLSKRMFEHKIKSGHFVEWAKVFDNYYGTPLKNVRDILRQGKSVLLCIDVQGGRQIKRKIPNAYMIFVKTPTLTDLQRRLEKRGLDTKDNVKLRLKIATKELHEAKQYDQVIVNDRLDRAFRELVELLRKALP